ncbi:LysM peptidoglycan-binding domain-containing protein [Sporosarcina sp. Te-1]|nr:LysM peptidoglycan-binding domain-containing protein [Sporosarcina sp. Te-1]
MDGVQLPVAPPKLKTKIKNNNKTITLINEGEVNLLKTAGLTELSFDIELPNAAYPYAAYPDGFQAATYYLEKFERLKIDKEPFQFIVTRTKPNGDLLFDTNLKVTLEDYEIIEDATNGFDIEVAIELKQYRDYGTKKLVVKAAPEGSKSSKKVATVTNRSSAKTPAKSYTVKAGDTLWGICQKELGNGSKYKEIAKLNGIKNPGMIKAGQVIRFE